MSHLADLRESGVLLVAGPLLGDRLRGLCVFEAEPEAARELKRPRPGGRGGRVLGRDRPVSDPGRSDDVLPDPVPALRGRGRRLERVVNVNRLAAAATNHCLTGCGIGEVLGMVLATWWGLANLPLILLAIFLAFVFGYSLTLVLLLRAGTALRAAIGIALVADTFSIATMEAVDNAVLLVWPGAPDAGLRDVLFWGSLALSLVVAWGPTFLVNRALIRRGKGHARAHAAHGH